MSDVKKDIPAVGFIPDYPGVRYYARIFGGEALWEADPWMEACKAYFESCYIHAGISGLEFTFTGPDAQKLLSDAAINNCYKWKIGKCKHLVMLDENGLITNHQLYIRDGEQAFRGYSGCNYPVEKLLATGKYDVKLTTRNIYIFQFSGPLSITVLEKLTQQSLRDLNFLDTRKITIPGLEEAEVEICRIGMSGTLAYELRGAGEYGPAVYDAAYKAGKPYGMKRLGWRAYTVNHMFGGFPQMTVSFEFSLFDDPDFGGKEFNPLIPSGSVEPENHRARYRTPVELDWAWMTKFDHDFVGREAMEKEAANPKRKIVNLLWNKEDLVDIYASQFTDDPYKFMEMPCAVQQPAGGHQDYVLSTDGKKIGIASNPTYSAHYHQTISQCIMDIDEIEEGKEVIILWGDYGKKMKEVRATITRYPYIDVQRNEDYDLSKCPSGLE